jgi:diguanylate cyclase (GGDEF)-like protein/PAS domain S-box-containing protein
MKYPRIDFKEGISLFKSVNRRLTISFGVVILVLMTVVLIIGGTYFKGVMDREARQLSMLLTQVLATSVSRVSFSGRYHSQLLLEEVQRELPEIKYLSITDLDGRVVASSDKKINGTILRNEPGRNVSRVLAQHISSQTRRTHLDGEPVIEITLPYRGGFNNSVQGLIQVGISQQGRDSELKKGIVVITLSVMLLSLMGIFFVRRLSLYFGNPVQQLASDMAATLLAIPDLLFELDGEGRYLQVLTQEEKLLADSREQLIGRTVHEMLPEDAAAIVYAALKEAEEKGQSHGRQFSLHLPAGLVWFELSVARKSSGEGSPSRFIVLSRDITERKNKDVELNLFANIYQKSSEAIMITDHENKIVAINPAMSKLTGYTFDDLAGESPKILASGQTHNDIYFEMWQALKNNGLWHGELWDRRKDGVVYPKWTIISAIHDSGGHISNYIATFTDISERKAAEERIYHLAHHDTLTGLYNRFSLEEMLGQAILQARRKNEQLAVLFIDMDRFKAINDTLGHHVGDALLIEVAKRLQSSVRDCDIVARPGGDEFVVVITSIDDVMDVAAVAGKIVEHLGAIYTIGEQELRSTPSIGISVFPEDGQDEEALMKNADVAMYHAKGQGRNNYQFFTAKMNAAAQERLVLERDLRMAMDNNQFELYYQPKVEAIGGMISSVEALLRWHHPVRGFVPPDYFIPVAEECSLIDELGYWVLGEACRQISLWRVQGLPLRMAVNLSPKQLHNHSFITRLVEIMAEHHVVAGELELEITETAAMADAEYAIEQMHSIRAIGVELAIDDFGTGYSSLSYLKLFPIQTLKLDRAFVRDIEYDENDATICVATIALAHNLGLKVVAEGVETMAQKMFLMSHDCDTLQGYLFSRPLPAAEITSFLQQNNGKDLTTLSL